MICISSLLFHFQKTLIVWETGGFLGRGCQVGGWLTGHDVTVGLLMLFWYLTVLLQMEGCLECNKFNQPLTRSGHMGNFSDTLER